MTKEKDAKMKQMTLRIPEKLHRAMKIKSAQTNEPMVQMIERLIQEYLKKGKK